MMRPGVATKMSRPWRSAPSCGPYGAPPWNTAVDKRCARATLAISSFTCLASSRVGAMTSILGERPLVSSISPSRIMAPIFSTMGKPNAMVFPVPVRLRAIMSLPSYTGLNDCRWMSVNWVMPLASRILSTLADKRGSSAMTPSSLGAAGASSSSAAATLASSFISLSKSMTPASSLLSAIALSKLSSIPVRSTLSIVAP
mmetsp:Transcript_34249/g.70026  ORF Transcript_34249/g.70026 Transcript_34249/m.70026 type:complete len:200 (+) Transcript_34249:1386-1985(+)